MLQYFTKSYKKSIFVNNQLPQLLYVCNTETMKQNFPRVLHKHDDRLEFVFIVRGEGEHLIDGCKYKTKAGDILVFNSNVLHDERSAVNSDMVVFCCGINKLYLNGLEKNCLLDANSPAVLSSGKQHENIKKLLETLFTYVKDGNNEMNEICHYLLASLICIIQKLPQKTPHFSVHKPQSLIDSVKDYLDSHFAEDVELSTLAQRFQMSQFHLSRQFKEKFNFSPIQYLIRRRMGEAQSFLINTNYSVTKIAHLVGYDNVNYFSTQFSKMVGVSPSAYRLSWVGK